MTMIQASLLALTVVAQGSASAPHKLQADYDAMYRKCMLATQQTATSFMMDCSEEVSAKAKKEIATLYKQIHKKISSMSSDDAKQFEQSQRAWSTYRDSQCSLAGKYVGSPMNSVCPMGLNVDRVKELRELAGVN